MRNAVFLCVLLIPAVSGCRSMIQKPNTPADNLSVADLLATPEPAGDRFFLIIFGSESHPKRPKYTHTWATVVRVADRGPGCAPACEASTISWMPATLKIRPWNFHIEPGANLDLDTSIQEMLKHNEKIVMWGPYEIWHGAYRRFMTQREFLQSGAIGYQCIDSVGEAARTGLGCDCIHAITDMDPQFDRRRYPLRYFGVDGSRHAVEQILTRPVVIDAPKTHDWLIPALGLDRYCITREQYRGAAVAFSAEALANICVR